MLERFLSKIYVTIKLICNRKKRARDLFNLLSTPLSKWDKTKTFRRLTP